MEDLVAVGVGVAEVFGLHDEPARLFGLLGLHVHVAEAGLAPGALLAHGKQIPHAAHVAGAPGLDALADPALFLCQLLVEGRILLLLVLEAQVPAGEVVVVAAVVGVEAAPVDFGDPCRKGAGKGAVVGDEDEGADALFQKVFQPAYGLDVKVVGGLVQKQVPGGQQGPG